MKVIKPIKNLEDLKQYEFIKVTIDKLLPGHYVDEKVSYLFTNMNLNLFLYYKKGEYNKILKEFIRIFNENINLFNEYYFTKIELREEKFKDLLNE